MNVLCLTNLYPTEDDPSRGCFVRDLVDDVRALGTEVEVLAFDGRKRKRAYAEAGLDLRQALRGGPFDLIHAHYGLTGIVAVGQRSVPVVVTFHGSDTGDPRVRWQAWFSWFVARLATPIFVSRDGARRLGCPSAAVIPAVGICSLATLHTSATRWRPKSLAQVCGLSGANARALAA